MVERLLLIILIVIKPRVNFGLIWGQRDAGVRRDLGEANNDVEQL